MKILVALEKFPAYRTLVWALEHPGLFCYGADDREALSHFPQAVLMYREWVSRHDPDNWLQDLGDFDIHLTQTFAVYKVNEECEINNGGYEVNAWFQHDWKPPTRLDTSRALKLLTWSRQDLLAETRELSPEKLDQTYPGERWSIRGVMGHVANAEWWYLTRMNLTDVDRHDLPEDAIERLAVVRKLMEKVLPSLEGIKTVMGTDGEFWSARKVIRRAVWHELDHIDHIRKLIKMA